ncbi:MAG: DMT family protein [Sumerlaeia bacterium]
MKPYILTVVMLIASNIFMTFAWYAHLRDLAHKPWIVAALISWGIALFEYLIQVPANRIGHGVMSVGQLKLLQEVITLTVFVPFAVFYMKEKLTWDYLWAGLCLMGAVFFVFRGKLVG